MKMLRYLLAMSLICGLSGMAKADDFQMVVIDPLPKPVPITSDYFTATLTSCKFGSYIGCFSGENETGAPITSLKILIPIFDYHGPQTAGCAPYGFDGTHKDIFSIVSCGTTPDGKYFILNFSGGVIPIAGTDCDHDGDGGKKSNGDDEVCSVFSIAEAGVKITKDFNPFQLTVIANAPEPNSFWLMSTGFLSIGLFGMYRRRHMLFLTRS